MTYVNLSQTEYAEVITTPQFATAKNCNTADIKHYTKLTTIRLSMLCVSKQTHTNLC